jgi:hypothetical protein
MLSIVFFVIGSSFGPSFHSINPMRSESESFCEVGAIAFHHLPAEVFLHSGVNSPFVEVQRSLTFVANSVLTVNVPSPLQVIFHLDLPSAQEYHARTSNSIYNSCHFTIRDKKFANLLYATSSVVFTHHSVNQLIFHDNFPYIMTILVNHTEI